MQVSSLAGCPFSAVIENEITQTLADGTSIRRKFKELVYRDSLGRIRYESYGATKIDKDDPETPNLIRIYDPVGGFRYLLMPQSDAATRSMINEPAANPRVNAQPQHSSAQLSATKQMQESRPERVVEKLGSQQMEGLSVTGRRETLTIPAGAQGNDRPFVVVSEVWDSSDMGIRLLEKNSDPRAGDLERRMTNLNRTEPDPALFHVPADYTIKGE
jgi:hypothetical protein